MSSDSIAEFLEKFKNSQVIPADQFERLVQLKDFPQSDLRACFEFLQLQGFTRHQLNLIYSGRVDELNFAGYPIVDELGTCPGGNRYLALHPSLRTPLILRRLCESALAPTDSVERIVERARVALSLNHPHLHPILDVGVSAGDGYATIDQLSNSSTLEDLVKEIGPMPSFLAAEYGREIASALRSAHERGMWHGEVQPGNIFIGPITSKLAANGLEKKRPAPNAKALIVGLGLVPIRPPAAIDPNAYAECAYLPPERIDSNTYQPLGDIYSLGAVLYFMLTGRTLYSGESAEELFAKIRSSEPVSLAALRPDLPPGIGAEIHQLIAKNPGDRPSTAADVELMLTRFCRAETLTKLQNGMPASENSTATQSLGVNDWDAGSLFSTSHAEPGPVRRKETSPQQKARTKLLIVLGLLLHVSAVAILVAIFWFSACDSKPDSPAATPTKKEKENNKSKKGASKV